jgi:hypothetical protein
MPIALLLYEATAAFRFGARVLTPWNHLVQVEEVLIDRARSAFLYKWFGSGLPLHGFHLRVAIVNIAELRKRYAQVKAESRQRAEGPNLTEPLFGMAGVAAGMILTPGVALGTTISIVRSLDWNVGAFTFAWHAVVSALAILVSPFVGAVAVALTPALAAAGFGGYLFMGVTNAPVLRSFYDMLGGLAKLLESATRFIKLLLGPRSEVKNPVLAGMLHLFDQFAKLFPFGLALVAVIVNRFGPLLLPLAASMRAFIDLAGNLVDTIKFILDDFVEHLKALFEGPENIVAPIKHLLGWLEAAFSKILPTFNELLDEATATLERWYEGVGKLFKDWNQSFADLLGPLIKVEPARKDAPARKAKGFFGTLGEHLKNLLTLDPTVVKLGRLIDALALAGDLLKREGRPKPKEKEKESVFDPFIAHAKKWAGEAEQSAKSFPDLPEFESPDEMMVRLGLLSKHGLPKEKKELKKGEGRYDELVKKAEEALPPVSEAVTKYVKRARYPTSAFAFEEKALAAEYGAATLPEALSKAHLEVSRLRDALVEVVARVLPPELRHLLARIDDASEMFDETMTFDRKKAGRGSQQKPKGKKSPQLQFPVKDLPKDNGLLRPVVQRLHLHSKSGRREELRDFMEQLQQQLKRPYPAPA